MLVNSISTEKAQNLNKIKYMTAPISTEKKNPAEGYAPVTANLWGAKSGNAAFAYGAFIPNFGASRPTNNPVGFDKMEADTQSGFRLSTLEHPVICPDCGKPIMTKPIFAAIKQELDQADEKTYLKVVESHSEFLYPQEQKILKHIQKVQAKHPEKTIQEIVQKERKSRLNQLERRQYKVLDQIGQFAEELPYADKSKIAGLLTVSSDVIFERNTNFAFQRKKFIELADQLQLSDEATKKELMKLANKLPSSNNSETSWYVKYGGVDSKKKPYTSRVIAEKMLAPTYTNTDHVHPWNLGGLDATSNFWLMHARCNIIKTDKPFVEWLNEDRENRVEYIKEYLTSTQDAINESKDPAMHPKYDLYAAKIAKTIYYETNGEVDFTKDFPLPEGYDVPRPAEKPKAKA